MEEVFLDKIKNQVHAYQGAIMGLEIARSKGITAGSVNGAAGAFLLLMPLSNLFMFGTEVALKGIIYKETGDNSLKIHDINKLFSNLSKESKNYIYNYFLKENQINKDKLGILIKDYSWDFIEKRYLYEDDAEMIDLTFYSSMFEVAREILMK